jgi:predicted ester cyclase
MRGTHAGEFQGIPTTGARMTVVLLDMIHVQDDRIVEQWGGPDVLDLVRQLDATIASREGQPPKE